MIRADYARTMAAYNKWQNDSLYAAAGTLDDAARKQDRGAFFGSIHATLNHLLWGNRMWMSRFTDSPKPAQPNIPASVDEGGEWAALVEQRLEMDEKIIDWAAGLTDEVLAGDLSWFSGAIQADVTKPLGLLVTHFFNHQTHHRGQITTLLAQTGLDIGVTDLPFLPEYQS